MSTRVTETGVMTEITASGVLRLDRRQTVEAGELLEHARQVGRGSVEMVAGWLTSSGEPRALRSILEGELARRGYLLDCPMCQAGADSGRISVAKARRRYGIAVGRGVLLEHRQHAAKRRPRPIAPGTTRRRGLPASDAVRDGDQRKGEPSYD